MSERAHLVIRAIDYMEYVAAWHPIPWVDRPRYRVVRRNGSWIAIEVGDKL